MEITLTHVGSVLGPLVAACAALWALVNQLMKRERKRNDNNEKELSEYRKEYTNLAVKVAKLEGNADGHQKMANMVLDRVTELKNK